LRLWTAAANEAGVATFRKNGLREVARFTRMDAEVPQRSPSRFVPFRAEEDLWSRARSSEFLSRSGGYVSYDYGFIKVGPDVLAALERSGAILGFDAQIAVVSGSSEGYVERALEVEPLAGDLAALLAEARVLAAERGKARVETFLPHDSALLGTARGAGFTNMEWGQEAILCEKPLGSAPSA